jgi:hypothetical protein
LRETRNIERYKRRSRGPTRPKILKRNQLKPRLWALATEAGRLEGRPVPRG